MRTTLQRVLVTLLLLTGAAGVGEAQAKPLIGVASGTYAHTGDARRLASVGARWAYDWSPSSPLAGSTVEYVPMAWGARSVTSADLAAWRAASRSGRAAWLLGFNEPDMVAQANMTPDAAVALWPRLASTGLRLASPAVASPWTPSQTHPERTWLDDFMIQARARGLRIDAIALHFYGDWTDPANVSSIEHALEKVHARWHRPVWVTEIGTLPAWRWEGRDPHSAPTTALARAYLRRVIAMLSAHSWVARVAWFMDRCSGDCGSSSLFDQGGHATALGRALRAVARA
jgi:hypothetical protein